MKSSEDSLSAHNLVKIRDSARKLKVPHGEAVRCVAGRSDNHRMGFIKHRPPHTTLRRAGHH